jgi:hypothetical protein
MTLEAKVGAVELRWERGEAEGGGRPVSGSMQFETSGNAIPLGEARR